MKLERLEAKKKQTIESIASSATERSENHVEKDGKEEVKYNPTFIQNNFLTQFLFYFRIIKTARKQRKILLKHISRNLRRSSMLRMSFWKFVMLAIH